jgi:hypothetical protein
VFANESVCVCVSVRVCEGDRENVCVCANECVSVCIRGKIEMKDLENMQ